MKRFISLFLAVVLVVGLGSVARAQELSPWEKQLLEMKPIEVLQFASFLNKEFSIIKNNFFPGALFFNDYRLLRAMQIGDSLIYIEDGKLEGDFSGFDLGEMIFDKVDFVNSQFFRTSFNRSTFWNCNFEGCDFNASFNGASFVSSEVNKQLSTFENSYINIFGGSYFAPGDTVNFHGISFNNCGFNGSHNSKANFLKCSFNEASYIAPRIAGQSIFNQCSGLNMEQIKAGIEVMLQNNNLTPKG